MTEFRRRLRLHQARWREAHGHPVGSQPIVPKKGARSRPVGSRLALDYARETGANFVTPAAREAVRVRTATIEPHQTLDHQRLWADLLWSPSLAFNLFGEIDDAGVHALCPDAPGSLQAVRFAHSPGRFDPQFLNSLRAFDAAFELDGAIVAVDVKYNERRKAETPRPENVWRYTEVAERSGAFAPGAVDALKARSELCVMWLEHLLLLSMLQHPSGAWGWGRYVVVHPAGNTDMAELCDRYRGLLADDSTFASVTLEKLLGTGGAVRERYVPTG
jgi:PD-(D/E)XK nuclease superfamily